MKQIKLFEEHGYSDEDTTVSFEDHVNNWMKSHTVHAVTVVGKGDGYIQICVTYEEE